VREKPLQMLLGSGTNQHVILPLSVLDYGDEAIFCEKPHSFTP